MTRATGRNAVVWTWIAAALVAMIGVAVLVVGVLHREAHLLFGGAMFVVIAGSVLLHERALRPGADDALPSHAEKAAWSQIGMGLAVILVLGGMSLGSMRGAMAPYLLFGAYALIVACYPVFRRRFVEEGLRHREVAEDERDRMLRAQGDYLSKRLLELSLVAVAVAWVLIPEWIRSIGEPLQVAALLLLPVLAANVAGEARVARLHWRDRQ